MYWNRGVITYRGPVLRYSGEVTTSLGNTLNNICCLCVAREVACGHDLARVDWDTVVAEAPFLVEGDDSIQPVPLVDGVADRAYCDRICAALASMGLVVKPEISENAGVAAFCANRYRVRSDGTIARYSRDPVLSLAKLCWTSSRFNRREMLALKCEAAAI